jgi:3-isopropylmalate dehydrogenase
VHGSAPKYAGRNIANPIGAILSAALLLETVGWRAEAARVEAAVIDAIREAKTTSDIGGTLGTKEAGDWIAARVRHSS